MALQVFVVGKTPLALKAGERLHSRVDPHVQAKVSFLRESLPALSAGERFRSGVNSHVDVESYCALACHSTATAHEGFVCDVSRHVPGEQFSVSESRPAVVTAEMALA